MALTNTAKVDADQLIQELFNSSYGLMLLTGLLTIALLYPKFGYAKCSINLNFNDNRDRIIDMFNKTGYSLYSEENGVVTFRATTTLKRVLMWSDKITVDTVDNNSIMIDGLRKDVVLVEIRLNSIVENK